MKKYFKPYRGNARDGHFFFPGVMISFISPSRWEFVKKTMGVLNKIPKKRRILLGYLPNWEFYIIFVSI